MILQNRRNRQRNFAALAFSLATAIHPVFSQLIRQPNTTLHFPTETQATGDFVLTNALPGIRFDKPVAVATPRGETNRLFVVERVGRIVVINDLQNPVPETFLDMRDRVVASSWSETDRRTEGLSSVAFHPQFATNGRFFVTYNTFTNTSQGDGHHNRLSEFRANPDLRSASPDSEMLYITQYDEGDGHNINDAHFGPDGYLYVAIGDEGDAGTGDDYNNAQRIDKDFFSAIMRIDVDERFESLSPNPHLASAGNYRIPADNPFVGAISFLGNPVDPEKVRTEFFAVGLRNAWRMSFDPLTGAIYEGDVGQHGREEINLIVKGGNYGWAFKEGSIRGPKGTPPAGFEFISPIWDYGTGIDKDFGYSVTGGVVYRGARIPALYGRLIYADFVSGNVWAINVDQTPISRPEWLLEEKDISSFGYDPRDGDVLAVNHRTGSLLRLTFKSSTAVFPAKLSEAGIFRDLATLSPQNGIYPFDINLPFWSDGAIKTRWFSLPETNHHFGFRAEQNWVLPAGAVWIKHFELETRPGDVSSRKRVETRVMARTENNGYGITYKWNDDGTDADLVSESGEDKTFAIMEAGQTRQQVWRYPSRQQCMSCHTEAGGFALGFNTAQLNKTVTHGAVATNQLAALASASFLSNPPAGVHGLRSLAALEDTAFSRTYRVKSYLAANCAFCHQPEGTASLNAFWDGRITTPFSKANILWGRLYNNIDPEDKVVTPGKPEHSVLVRRMESHGRDRMPPIGSTVIDQAAVNLLRGWIKEETTQFEDYSQWTNRVFAASPQANRAAEADPDADGASNYAEYLIGSDPSLHASKMGVSMVMTNGQISLSFLHPRNRAILLETSTPGVSPWELLQSPGNRMLFPAVPLKREVLDSVQKPHQIYRLRVMEP